MSNLPLCAAISVGGLVSSVLPYLLRLADREPLVDARSRVLAYSRAVKRLVVALAVAATALILVLAMIEPRQIGGWAILLAFFAALILPLLLETFLVRIAWDDSNIYTRSAWRRSRTIPLSAVRSCDYSVKLRWYRIYTNGHGVVRLPFDLRRLPEEKWLIHQSRGLPELLSALPCPSPGQPPRTAFLR